MFKRLFEKRGSIHCLSTGPAGISIVSSKSCSELKINDLSDCWLIESDSEFAKLCRIISLTEQRGFRQVEILPLSSVHPR